MVMAVANSHDGFKPQIVQVQATGPNPYTTGGFTITVAQVKRVKRCVAIECNNSAYQPKFVSFSNNIATIKVYYSMTSHAHDILFKANAAANAVTMAANSLRNASAGDLTVAGDGADGGCRTVAKNVGSEVITADGVNMSGITFRLTVTA
jgi:hypothetical protein